MYLATLAMYSSTIYNVEQDTANDTVHRTTYSNKPYDAAAQQLIGTTHGFKFSIKSSRLL